MEKDLLDLAAQVGSLLLNRQLSLTVAESCTGGQLAYVLTSIPGSSQWFERGFVTYSNLAKQEMLGVTALCLNTHGAVSRETALAMATGAVAHSAADLGIAITGIAGPDGGTVAKPVGTVWLAWSEKNNPPNAKCFHFTGDRLAVRQAATREALLVLKQLYTH